jgi:hypothetical protein
MSVPFEPIVPSLDNPPSDPDRIPGEELLPDQGAAPVSRMSSPHCPTWGLLCNGVRLQSEDRT